MKLYQKFCFLFSRTSYLSATLLIVGLLFASTISAKQITGKVTEKSSGETLPGVSVIVKGTSRGVITDVDGKFSLNVTETDKVLLFSYVGMATQEVEIGALTVINVALERSQSSLEEIIVVGYGTQRKADLTGAISQIGAKELGDNKISSTEQILSGKIAGVNVISSGGEPGAGSRIRVRGMGTMLSGNEPLYVIDGIPSGFGGSTDGGFSGIAQVNKSPIDNLNPNDIESVTVLKDASSAAIYGASAANGVILITTKKGKSGKTVVDYNGQVKFGTPVGKYETLDANAFKAQQVRFGADQSANQTANVDWQDEILRNTTSQSHDVSLSGGSTNSTYRGSLRYTNDEGAIINTDSKSYNVRFNLTQKALQDRATLGLNFNYGNSEYNNASTQDILGEALAMNPTIPIKDANGAYIKQFIGVEAYNPIQQLLETTDIFKKQNFGSTASVKIDLYKGLSLNSNYTYSKSTSERNYYVPKDVAPVGVKDGGRAGKRFSESSSQKYDITLNYTVEVTSGHNVDAMVGNAYDINTWSGTQTEGAGYQYDQLLFNNIGSYAKEVKPSSWAGNDKLSSFFGRVNYNGFDRYLVQASFRRDASSKLRENNAKVFPSFSLGWRVSEEPFLKDRISWLSNLKVRYGWGQMGNQNIPGGWNSSTFYVSPMSYNMGNATYLNGVRASRTANLNLQWETTTTSNFGLDYAILKNRIDGAIEVYTRRTSDMLFVTNTIAPSASTDMVANLGTMLNKGFEFSVNARVIEGKDFKLALSANIAYNTNKVEELIGTSKERYYGPFAAPGYSLDNTQIFKVGNDVSSFYGYKFAGLDANGKELFYGKTASGADTITATPTAKDKDVIGKAMPNLTYSFNINGSYKNFDFAVALRGEAKRDVFNVTNMVCGTPNRILSGSNALTSVESNNMISTDFSKISDRWVEKAGFLRLDNLTLGYTFNTKGNKYISKARVFAVGSNLFVMTNYTGSDPEVFAKNPSYALGTSNIPSQGLDFYMYPRSRSFSFGFQLTF